MKYMTYKSMIVCCMAMSLVACNEDCDLVVLTAGEGNSIILDLSSESLPVSRVVTEGAEIAVSHLDVLIFDASETLTCHERVSGSVTGSGIVTLSAKRSDFAENAKYWVYLLANSTADAAEFESDGFSLTDLRSMMQSDEDVHLTGLSSATNAPQTFLMDGVAYDKSVNATEPQSAAAVVLNDGVESADTELAVTLRRAAAKIVVRINRGDDVKFDDSYDSNGAGYYMRNMPYTTAVIAGTDAEASLTDTDMTSGGYFNWTDDAITVTAYTYAHEWADKSQLEKEVRLIVNIPMYYAKDAQEGEEPELRRDSWYQIPVSESKELKRNTCYEVVVTVNAPGGTERLKPIELKNIKYEVQKWEEKTIDIGGAGERPIYLNLNTDNMEMHNIADDNTTLLFTSSSDVKVEITSVYYKDKFDQTQTLTDAQIAAAHITAVADESLTGHIDIHSDLPENNAIRYIELKVTNADDATARTVTIAQYPLEYITNIQGWYSYRSDFGGTTFEDRGNRTTSNNYFRSKVAVEITSGNNKGLSNIYGYTWNNNSQTVSYQNNSIYTPGNARMYHVVISATSKEYTLGKPRLDAQGYTESSAANNKLVSPSFMLASQLGALSNTFSAIGPARTHCQQYVEVYKDKDGNKVVLDDWRLPTRAELEIIIKYQNNSDAMDEVIRRQGYWCADGGQVTNSKGQSGTGYLRCIRDAY